MRPNTQRISARVSHAFGSCVGWQVLLLEGGKGTSCFVREKGRSGNRSQKTGRAGSRKNGSMARIMGCGGVLNDFPGET